MHDMYSCDYIWMEADHKPHLNLLFPPPLHSSNSAAHFTTGSMYNLDYMADDLPELEARIMAVEKHLSDLKFRRNHLSSLFCQLPTEMVVKIFKHAYRVSIQDESHETMEMMRQKIRVCRYVWSIAKAAPELWSFIQIGFGDSLRYLELSRSQKGSFPFILKALCYPVKEMCTIISGMAPQISELNLRSVGAEHQHQDDYMGHLENLYKSLLSECKWPVLRRAVVQKYQSVVASPGKIDAHLFSGASGTLTSLYLRDKWSLGLTPPQFPLLKFLKIDSLVLTEDNLVVLHTWFSNTPSISSIDIHFSEGRPIPMDDPPPNAHPVALPQLAYLHLYGYPDQLMNVLWLLPDPSEELSLHYRIRRKYSWDVGNQDPVIAYIMAYRSRHQDHVPSCAYKLVLRGIPDHDPQFWLKPTALATSSQPHRRISLRGEGLNQKIIDQIASAPRTVECASQHLIGRLTDVLDTPGAIIENLEFARWSVYWSVLPAIYHLEIRLKLLKNNGRGIKKLSVDAAKSEANVKLASRWIQEGLVEEMIMGTQVSFDDD